jgi:hypothetical protein
MYIEPDTALFSSTQGKSRKMDAGFAVTSSKSKERSPGHIPLWSYRHACSVQYNLIPVWIWDTVHALGYNALKRGTQYIMFS